MRHCIYFILLLSFASLSCKKDAAPNTDPAPIAYNHNRNPGNSASDFLRNTTYRSLKIELQYMPGFRPDPRSLHIFIELLNERLNKPAGIYIEEKEIDPTLLQTFSLNDIKNIEAMNRTVYTQGDQMSAYILFTSGSYYNGSVLGLSYKNTSICFFGEPLRYFPGGTTEEDKIMIMAMLLTHEFGHLLGLVDMGSSMVIQHRDIYNGNHCDNSLCLMHHSFEPTTQVFARVLTGNPSFDANCITDLRANGGK